MKNCHLGMMFVFCIALVAGCSPANNAEPATSGTEPEAVELKSPSAVSPPTAAVPSPEVVPQTTADPEKEAAQAKIAELEKKLSDNPGAFDWTTHNDLRHNYGVTGQEEKAFSHMNVILQNSPMDEYTMNILMGWALPADIPKAKSNLQSVLEKYPQFPFVTAACLLKLSGLETDPNLSRQYLDKLMGMKGAEYAKYRELASESSR